MSALARQRLTRGQWFSFAAVYACIFANGIGMGLSLPLLSIIMERNGVSGFMNGLNATFGSVAMLIVTPLIPAIAARLGTMRFLIACYALAAFSLIAFRAIDSLAVWFLLRFLLNAALQGLFLASELWINQIAHNAIRGRAITIYASLFSAGLAAGPIIIQGVGTTGWEPFLIGAALIMAAALPLFAVRQHIPAIAHTPPGAMWRFLALSPIATFAALTYGALEVAITNFLPVYTVRLGTSEARAVLLMTAWGLGNMLLQPLIGWIADRADRRIVLAGCGMVGIAGAAILPLLGGALVPSLVLVFVWGGVVVGLYSIGLAHLGSKHQGADLSAANAAFAFLYGLGATLGPGIAGAAIDLWNPHGLALAVGVMAAAYTILAVYRIAIARKAPRQA
ncbi:MAG: MFS transporter [Alphaproteobacteria bacterium]|nr:MFS transporter [Alphaproteobacteria bacterium]